MPFPRIQNDGIASLKLRFGVVGRGKPAATLADVEDLNLLEQAPPVGRKEVVFRMFPNGIRTVRRYILLTDSFGNDAPLKVQVVGEKIFGSRHRMWSIKVCPFVL
jgi:hypothetical protein